MLFASGFNLKKKAFLKNISYISMFGILGTFAFFIVVVLLILEANQLSNFWIYKKDIIRDARDINNIRTLSTW